MTDYRDNTPMGDDQKNMQGGQPPEGEERREAVFEEETSASSEGAKTLWRDADEVAARKLIREEIRRNYRPKNSWLRTLALVLVGAVLGSALSLTVIQSGVLPDQKAGGSPQSTTVDIKLDSESTVENAIAKKNIASIVGVTSVVQTMEMANPFLYGIPRYSESVGSGIIVDAKGYILTNSHVVGNGRSSKITVRLSTGEEMEANLVWNDASLDLAMLKVERQDLSPIELGDSSTVQVGDKSVAIGNPLGLDLQSTLTSGYISGLNRTIQLQDGGIMEGLLQTDAAINAGNSGGALFNAKGQVIGINTARPQSADGIGFAIPINVAKPIIEKVVQTGSFESLYLGITGMNVQVAKQFGLEGLAVDSGALVREVYADSPAAKAGLTAGDIITAIDDQPVESMNSLKTHLLAYHVGDTVTITYYRGQEKKTASLQFTNFVPQETPSR